MQPAFVSLSVAVLKQEWTDIANPICIPHSS